MSTAERDERLLQHLRALTDEDARLTPPPPGVWEAIAAEIDHDQPQTGSPELVRRRTDSEVVAPIAFVRQRRARTGHLKWLGAVAAALVVVAMGLSLRPHAIDATAELAVLEEGQQPAVAELRGATLRIAADLPPISDGVYEVWLLDEAVEQIVSLGLVREDGLYPLPAGVDPSALPVVDISIEPEDGDPSHSGRSVLRGVFS